MDEPDLVLSQVGDEDIVATLELAGDDELIVTPTRTLHYEAEGLLSDESLSEYGHDFERLTIRPGRRKASLTLEYPVDGTKQLSVPKASLDSTLQYLLAGQLNVKGVTEPGESVRAVYRFNELTLVITSQRIVSHVGSSAWDSDYSEYSFDDLTGFDFEEGAVATQVVLYIDGRSQRLKIPKNEAGAVTRDIKFAIFEYYDVDSKEEFENAVAADDEEGSDDSDAGPLGFDGSVEPLTTTTTEESEDAEDTTPAGPDINTAVIEAALRDLEEAIETQRAALDAQEAAIGEIVDELTRDR